MSLRLRRQREWLHNRTRQPKGDYPVGTLAWYGPDDRQASKAVAAVLIDADETSPSALERWSGTGRDLRQDIEVLGRIVEFFQRHQVKRVATTDRILGCPHEEGIDYPLDEACPICSFWADRDRFTGERIPSGHGRHAGAAPIDEPSELIDSSLSQRVAVDGRWLQVDIYRSPHGRWVLEVINDAGTSNVWNETFPTDADAWAAFRQTLSAEGVAGFDDDPSETSS